MSFTEREMAYTEELMERFAHEIVYKCPRCGLEQMLLKEGARIRELEELLRQVILWEQDYRTRNNLGSIPPHPFQQAISALEKK